MIASFRCPLSWPTLKMLIATGVLYLMMMGSTFSSLGVILPHMVAALKMNWGQAGFGFTLLALAAGLSSPLPAPIIRRWGGRTTLGLGVLTLVLAYVTMALCGGVFGYDLGATLLGIGFSLIGAVPALHILSGWEQQKRSLVFGAYLAFGGLGGALWPSLVEGAITLSGDWRFYWWGMAGLMAVVGALCLAVIRDRDAASAATDEMDREGRSWTLQEALRTSQFYIIGSAIAATYLIASTVNAFAVAHLTMIGVRTAAAVVAFSIQSACHAVFPAFMGGIAERVGVRTLLVIGVAIQAVGMVALAAGSSLGMLVVFAIGVGGGHGTVFLATTLSLQKYFGRQNYAQIFGANQLFTTVSVIGPAIIGWLADLSGRFDLSFVGCAGLLLATAAAAATLRPPKKQPLLVAAPAS